MDATGLINMTDIPQDKMSLSVSTFHESPLQIQQDMQTTNARLAGLPSVNLATPLYDIAHPPPKIVQEIELYHYWYYPDFLRTRPKLRIAIAIIYAIYRIVYKPVIYILAVVFPILIHYLSATMIISMAIVIVALVLAVVIIYLSRVRKSVIAKKITPIEKKITTEKLPHIPNDQQYTEVSHMAHDTPNTKSSDHSIFQTTHLDIHRPTDR